VGDAAVNNREYSNKLWGMQQLIIENTSINCGGCSRKHLGMQQ